MIKKYFGTDGIRGRVNQTKINGEMFFKFGLAVGTYFKNQKKKKADCNYSKRYQVIRIHSGTSISIWINVCRHARKHIGPIANQWSRNVN